MGDVICANSLWHYFLLPKSIDFASSCVAINVYYSCSPHLLGYYVAQVAEIIMMYVINKDNIEFPGLHFVMEFVFLNHQVSLVRQINKAYST